VTTATEKSAARYAVTAGFLGWTLDAFDFFILTFIFAPIAKEFGTSISAIALTVTASLATRWIGAILFGLLADRYGRRVPLIVNILYYSLIEVLSGLAPNYTTFLVLRLLYGIGMGGEWGVGASLTMESVPVKWRGVLSGLLQEGYALGFLLAAGAYRFVFPHWGWRPMFFVGGLPALLTLFIRAKVTETEAWKRSRTDWATYRRAIFSNWPRFAYLVLLMAMVNFISHGTQDMYPTYLQQQKGFGPHRTSDFTAFSMVGAILGGLTFGHLSDLYGRRRAMVTAILLGVLTIPLWMFAPNVPLILVGGFLMQSSAHQRTLARSIARIFPRVGVPVRRAPRGGQSLHTSAPGGSHDLRASHGIIRARGISRGFPGHWTRSRSARSKIRPRLHQRNCSGARWVEQRRKAVLRF
jgi:SHS family lactate transporter-like MFS transporter